MPALSCYESRVRRTRNATVVSVVRAFPLPFRLKASTFLLSRTLLAANVVTGWLDPVFPGNPVLLLTRNRHSVNAFSAHRLSVLTPEHMFYEVSVSGVTARLEHATYHMISCFRRSRTPYLWWRCRALILITTSHSCLFCGRSAWPYPSPFCDST